MVRRITNTSDIGGVPAPRPIHINTKGVTLPQAVSHPFIFHRNHPKQADFYMRFLLVNFAVKNGMFNL